MSRSDCQSQNPGFAVDFLESRLVLAVGGGLTDAGFVGAYYANAQLAGPPVFTHHDVRIDFDWGQQAPGGSLSPNYQAVGADYFSARWTGQLLSQVSETFTFRSISDDGLRLYLKASDTSDWNLVIDNWPTSGQPATAATGTFALTAGKVYDIRVEYREFTGQAQARLLWSSPSVPEEVIEPLSNNGYHVDGRGSFMFADVMRTARPTWQGTFGNPAPGTDAFGWPRGDGEMVVWEGASDPYFGGTYNARFTGRADVSAWPVGSIKFKRLGDNTIYSSLTSNQIYDPTSNTSSFQIVVDGNVFNSPFVLRMQNTRRLPTDTTATGITNLEIMRPQTIGGTNPYPFGTIYTDTFKSAASIFTSYRWLDTNGNLTEREWTDRTLPSFGRADRPNHSSIVHKGWTYEYQIMFANETGKDLYLTVPFSASNDYFQKLAQLIRYGSRADGSPATSADDPLRVYPGLNPNLKAYIELSNEVWNSAGAFEQTKQADDAAVAAGRAPAGSPECAEWDIINYDNTLNTNDPNGFNSFDFKRLGRWYAQRTVRLSEQFRTVFGDQMGDQARVLLYWQYNNSNNTALNALKFLDDYFNNGDGINHVANPNPVSHYLWGAGGAAYYGSGNPQGRLANDLFTNASFDNNGNLPLNRTTVRPTSVTGWTFTGNAGLLGRATTTPVPTYTSDGFTLGTAYNPAAGDYTAYVMRGGRFSTELTFTQSGRYAIGFNARGHHSLPLDFTIDGMRITPQYKPYRGVGEADPATGPAPIEYSWNTNFGGAWQDDLTTATFEIVVPEGGSKTVTFSVAAAGFSVPPTNPNYAYEANQTMQFDGFYVASVDRLFEGGIPDTGQALGQVGTGNWTRDRNQIAQYAQAYGLRAASYETGWSIGGDNGASPLQNWAKYRDPRATLANNAAIDSLNQAGYGLATFGVYEQWRDFDLANASDSALYQSFLQMNNRLPLAPAGLALPTTLTPALQTLAYSGSGTNWSFTRTAKVRLSPREWMSWNVVVPTTGTYSFTVRGSAGATAQLTVDDTETVVTGSTNQALTGNLFLTRGLHTVKLRSTAGTFQLFGIDVAQPGAPAAPTWGDVVEGDGVVTINWSAVAGATGYRIRWGTTPGQYSQSQTVAANQLSSTSTNLTNGTNYWLTVHAVNVQGEGLPTVPRGITPLANEQVGELGVWEFFGYLGAEPNGTPLVSSGRAVVSPLVRGPDLIPSDSSVHQFMPNRFSSGVAGAVWGKTLTEAISKNQYYQFTVTPRSGDRISLDQLQFQAWSKIPTTRKWFYNTVSLAAPLRQFRLRAP